MSNPPTEGAPAAAEPAPPLSDERLRREGRLRRAFGRPELGALAGTLLVFLFFGIVAGDTGMFSAKGVLNWLEVSAQLGIIAIGACLLMIAGEFDLSLGSMIGFAGMVIAIPVTQYGLPVWAAILLAFGFAMAVGYLNGIIVIRTGLPSFIVTLAFLFILRGLTIGLSRLLTNRTLVGGVREHAEGDWFAALFGGKVGGPIFVWMAQHGWMDTLPNGQPVVQGVSMVIVWWLALAVLANWLLKRTRYGNWIFASGGDAVAARNVGVPVSRVKISLFMFAAVCATVFAACQVVDFGSADSQRGMLKEFEAIIAAVIGGALLTGGYGSVVGACFGALIFGVVQMGIFYTGVNTDWFRVFLGVMLLIAVIFNNYVRKKVTGGR
ncbi:ABC transporter permease [Shumkonia mesophila]|uniref:ABC transporter permease n=1 Tax=Shumkonia mesophila TaxID=2838854 RepID=UPI002934EC42|nr:ABC transporter permease [Shumkonia mesophila]